MLRNKIYYRVKPFVPQALRTAIRRNIAVRLREQVRDTWPIIPGSERAPVNWPGWPGGKRFALVLTHDVEGPVGLSRCRQLMEVERELGFHSSFNFIPEGTYAVPPELREEMLANGFEVGVHDLKHDGRLYQSRREFGQKASRINRYLREWGAAGFRSGFMLHNLSWLHDLEIKYDMSTFDTDPFEPQPEGHHTIFPFVVSRSSQRNGVFPRDGYVELPYTLPQDSTLFLLLRERTPDIWFRKTEWIAAHRGMALVNVHPDYVCFDGEEPSSRAYPVAHYRAFLEHVRTKYRDDFWQPLPRELAEFVASVRPSPTFHRSRRICMVTHSFYESDNRVTRYAQALVARGDQVDVFALRRSPNLPEKEDVNGVNLVRIQDRFAKTERSKIAYLWPLLRFLRAAAREVRKSHARHCYDLVHAHNVPDFVVFSAWYPKLRGARIVLDIHDIVPEFFASKFGKQPKGPLYTLLAWMERISAAFADHVIVANHLWIDKYVNRTGTDGRCTPFINNVDSDIFIPKRTRRQDGKQIVLFPGGLQWHQGVDIAILAFKKVTAALPTAEFHIYGDGSAKPSLVRLARDLKLDDKVRFFDTLDIYQIARVMADADVGVVPKRADSFGNEAYSTKIMEFMSVAVPVIVSNTRVDRHYFDDSVVRFFPSGDSDALASEIISVLSNPAGHRPMVERALRYAAQNCWDNRKSDYLQLVDSLCGSHEVQRAEEPARAAA